MLSAFLSTQVIDTTSVGRSLMTAADATAARAAIGAGTSSFDGAFSSLSGKPTTLSGYGITDAQPLDSDLTAIAALTTTTYGRSLLTGADAAATRTTLGLGTLATQSGTFSGTSSGTNTGDQDLSGYLLSSTAASTYVPYTGATGAVNLGTNALTVGAVTASGSVVCPNGNTLSPALRIGSQGNSGFWTNDSTNTLYLNFAGTTYHRFYNSHHYLLGAIGFGSVSSPTAFFSSDAANTYNFRNSTNPQSIQLEGTYTSATNREYLKFRAVTGANFEIGPANGSAGGTLRGLTLGGYTNDSSTITPWLTFTNAGAATFASTLAATSLTLTQYQWIGWTGGVGSLITGDFDAVRLNNVGIRRITKLEFGTTTDVAIARNAADVVEVNNGTNGTYRDIIARTYFSTAGTITSSTPGINLTQTWNSGATAFTGALINITDAASASASLLQDWQVGGSSRVTLRKDGQMTFFGTGSGLGLAQLQGNGSAWFIYSGGTFQSPLFNCNGWYGMVDGANGGMQFYSGHGIVWSGTGASGLLTRNSLTGDIGLYRGGAGILEQRYGTTAQTFRLENTFTSTTNREYFQQSWVSNELRMGTAVGSAGGTQRSTVIGTWNAAGTWTPAITVATTGTTTLSNTLYTSSFSFMVVGNEITIARDTANTITQRNGANGQTVELANTYTSATSFEYGRFRWNTNEFRIGTAVGSAGGTQRKTVLGVWDSAGTWTSAISIETNGDITVSDAENLIFGSTTGTKIGTATTQKLAFWNATPIVQPTTGVAAATRTGGGGATVTDTDTFDGYTIAQIVKALRNLGVLA